MKSHLLTFAAGIAGLLAVTSCGAKKEQAVVFPNNVAWQDSCVRFTVINDGVIRLEYAPDGKFVDDPSFIAVNRQYEPAAYSMKESDNQIVVSTKNMSLTYQKGTGAFSAENLSIEAGTALTTQFVWHPGDVQKENLGGTYRTLDGYDGNRYYAWGRQADGSQTLPLESGLLARDGWTLIDDSEGLLFDGDVNDLTSEEMPWVKERESAEGAQDWYFLAYGHNYKQALGNYIQFAGRMPLPPRFAFGYWWSRYWRYSADDLRFLVKSMKEWNNPLDVLVIDMDWHYSDGVKGGWTGYTWNEELFPDPAGLLKEFDEQGIQVTMNLHPADGVSSVEEHYADFAKWLGREPKTPEERDTLEWCSSDKKYMMGWYETILRPLEKQGVDFWWLDWQQGLADKQIPSLSNTFWLNYTTFSDMQRNRTTRPMLYHRWGGLGNHRYQIGFSGDSYATWASLEYQPYFNSTASNVLYGYWSHDLGGHMLVHQGDKLDEELYIRWMQLGLFLPIMRTHSTNDVNMNKEPWALSSKENGELIAQLCRQREALVPYTYTAAREAYETGVSICRPMYYDYPESAEAYSNKTQYMYGDQFLVAPITKPMDKNGKSKVKVWLPEGDDWCEMCTGEVLKGGQTVERSFTLEQYPVYVKTGSILPRFAGRDNQSVDEDQIFLHVIPSNGCAEGQMYEDAGNDQQYATQYAYSSFFYETNADACRLTLYARKGQYEGMKTERSYSVRFDAVGDVSQVLVDGNPVEFALADHTLRVSTGKLDLSVDHVIEIQ